MKVDLTYKEISFIHAKASWDAWQSNIAIDLKHKMQDLLDKHAQIEKLEEQLKELRGE